MSNQILSDLTLRISTSTAELSEGLRQAGESINKFSKKAKEQGDRVRQGFSNIKSGVREMASSMTGALGEAAGGIAELGAGIPSVLTGIKGMTAGMGLLKVAIASTGIGLLVIALASLIAYFTKTQAGAEIVSIAMAAVGAVITTLIDTLSGFGEVLINVFSNPMESLKAFGDAIKNFILGRVELLMKGIKGLGTAFKLLFEGEFKAAANEAGKAIVSITRGINPVAWALEGVNAALDATVAKFGEASEKGQKAIRLQQDTNKLEREKVQFLERAAALELKISEAKTASKDRNNTEAQRLAAIQEAQRLQQQLSAESLRFAEEELRIKKAVDALGNNMLADDKATAELAVKALQIKRDESDKLRELLEQEVTIKGEIVSRGKEHAKIVEQRAKELEIARLTADTESVQKLKLEKIKPDEAAFKLPELKLKVNVAPVDFKPMISSFEAGVRLIQEGAAKLSEKFGQIGGQVGQATGAIASAFSQVMANRQMELENYYSREREQIESSKMSEEQKAAAITNLDKKVTEEKKKLAIKQAKMQKATALLGAIVNTAQGVTQALAQGGIAGLITGAIVAAAGAVQIGAIASQPLPAFANGGRMKESGMALVGERGPELVNLPAGANVTRANKTEQLLNKANDIKVQIQSMIRGEDLLFVLDETKRRAVNSF